MLSTVLGKKIRLSFLVVSLVMLLSACSIPIPLGNLLPALGESVKGEFKISELSKSGLDLIPFFGSVKSLPLVADTTGLTTFSFTPDLDLDGGNDVIELGGVIGAPLVNLSISYKMLFTKIGDFSGALELQPYLAPANASDIYSSGNRLGNIISLDLSNASQVAEATIKLNSNQLAAINAEKIRLGFQVLGEVTNITTETVGVQYDIQSFKITDLKIDVDQELVDSSGIDLSLENVDQGPVNGLVSRFILDYGATLQQSSPAFIKGVATVELYLKNVSTPGSVYASENFIQSVEIDLAELPMEVVEGQLIIEGDLLQQALSDEKITYGVKLKANSIGIEAVPGDESAVTFKYELTKLFGDVIVN